MGALICFQFYLDQKHLISTKLFLEVLITGLAMTLKADYSVLIAAAGHGTRSGLSYPKTLYPLQGKPILIHLLDLFSSIDGSPSIITSPSGKEKITACIQEHSYKADLIVQEYARGMGDAVLHFKDSPNFSSSNNVILAWGDIPFIQMDTLMKMLITHEENNNDFTFPTRFVDSAYTIVTRDQENQIIEVLETKELGIEKPKYGERDMGLFVFKKDIIFSQLEAESPYKIGKTSGEHGFLYVIKELILQGAKIESLPIATEKDLISLNHLEDVKYYAS
jgi:bifunctional UDP-N-acetylglucosamine pyrophosphorylase / glucosamine-1-phosphate N-acetyltransferase